MNKNTFEKITLKKGEMNVYDFGNLKLHAYKTNDFIDDEVFIIEKNKNAVLIESPCFFDNNKELEDYISEKNLSPKGILLAYHMAGGTFLKDVKRYSTKNADEYGHNGGGKQLIENFTKAFGDVFDNSIHTVTDYITTDSITIGNIKFNITITNDAFDIEIPEINLVYTHMLGHDCHSIVAGKNHADLIIKQLENYIAKGFSLVLTSHYTPEDLKDVQTKIDYLKELKKISENCSTGEEFKNAVNNEFKDYTGSNYLDITANFFFQ